MNELIKITNGENGSKLVSARELHEFLEVKTKYQDWFTRMKEYGFEENTDFTIINELAQKKEGSRIVSREQITHVISIEMAKELSMIQRTDKGKQARKYFIQCEKQVKEVSNKQIAPTDYLSALKALVQSEEQKALMTPKVEYYENVLVPNTYVKMITSTQIAKDLGLSAQGLNKKLNELGVIYKQGKIWMFYSEHQDKVPEYADYIINEHSQSLKWTEKGREWIIGLLKDKPCNL